MDGQTADSWSEILNQFDDASIYQSWAYGAVRWGTRNLGHLVMKQNGQILSAAQLRIARVPLLPTGIAYLRWGPLCQRKGEALNNATVKQMIACLRSEYSQKRKLTLKVIPNAYLLDSRGDAFAEAFQHSSLQPAPRGTHYKTVLVDLSASPEILRKQLDQKWRNQLNRSEKNGLVFEVSDSQESFFEFARLYEAMWRRKQFATSVDIKEFEQMQTQLSGPSRMQVFLARKEGQLLGGLVCSLMGNSAIYLLGATNETARELKAAYFLQWQAILWHKQHGARWYDLGGIDAEGNPGGYHFKSGFGGAEVTQLPTYDGISGPLGQVMLKAIAWLRRHKSPFKSPPATTH